MTLNLPLLYFVWTEEYCQTSPNKNKSPNLWHITSILVCCIFVHTYHSFSCQLQISSTYQLTNCRYLLETLQLFLLQNRVYSVARGAVHGAYVSSVLCWRPPAHDGIAQSSPSQLAWCRSTTNCSSWKMPRWNEKRSTEQRQQAASVHCTIMHFDEIFVWCSC